MMALCTFFLVPVFKGWCCEVRHVELHLLSLHSHRMKDVFIVWGLNVERNIRMSLQLSGFAQDQYARNQWHRRGEWLPTCIWEQTCAPVTFIVRLTMNVTELVNSGVLLLMFQQNSSRINLPHSPCHAGLIVTLIYFIQASKWSHMYQLAKSLAVGFLHQSNTVHVAV